MPWDAGGKADSRGKDEGTVPLAEDRKAKSPKALGKPSQALMGVLNLLGIWAQLWVRCRPTPVVCGSRRHHDHC